MNLSYKLTNSDFLEYQLYDSSKSKLHKKKRFRTQILVPIVYVGYGIYQYFKNQNWIFLVILLIAALLWFLLYPLFSKWRYKKHFEKHVEENYKNRINKTVDIEINENSLNAKDSTTESKISGSELKELIETKNHFFIKLSTDLSLIIPKHSIENLAEFKKSITELGAEYVDQLNWQWK